MSKKYWFLFINFLLPMSSYSQHYDSSAGLGFRTYPLGASVGAEGGYSWLFYGKTIDEDNSTPNLSDYTYGFVRGYLRGESSGVVNAAKVGVEVYPISFVKIFAQQAWSHRFSSSQVFNCGTENFYCPGPLNIKTWGAEVVGAYESNFGALSIRQNTMSTPSREWFEDYYSVLPGADGKDQLWQFVSAIGFKTEDSKKYGFLYSTEKFKDSEHRSLLRALFASQEFGAQKITILLGMYDSTALKSSFTAGLSWKYVFERGALIP